MINCTYFAPHCPRAHLTQRLDVLRPNVGFRYASTSLGTEFSYSFSIEKTLVNESSLRLINSFFITIFGDVKLNTFAQTQIVNYRKKMIIIQLSFRQTEFGIAVTGILNHFVKTKAVKSTVLFGSRMEWKKSRQGAAYCSTFVHLTQCVNVTKKQSWHIALSATKVEQYTAQGKTTVSSNRFFVLINEKNRYFEHILPTGIG